MTICSKKGKWASTQLNLHPGMVVLVKSNHPPQDWKMAMVEEVRPGRDGLLQVATIKDNGGKHKTLHPQANCSPHTKLDSKGCMFLVSLNRSSMLGVTIMLWSNLKRYLCTFALGWDNVMQEIGVISVRRVWYEVGVSRWCDRGQVALGVTWIAF